MTDPLPPVSSDPPPTSRVLVPFAGTGSGEAGLSWGQRELWQVMESKHTWLPIGAVQPLPAGTTVADAVADLRFVMSRYPSLRTRLRLESGQPIQVVSATGEVSLEIVAAPDDSDPAEVAKQVEQRYRKTGYDFVEEWPIRMAVVRHRGELTHRVWIMCHLVTDGSGAEVILADLAERDLAEGDGHHDADRDAGPGASPMPPLAQARWQGSPAGLRQSARALRHWERALRTVPANRFPPRAEAPDPRYWQARFTSPALHLALGVVGSRTRVETGSVLLAVFAVAMARVFGSNPAVVQVLVGNRFRPGLARTVSPIMQNGLCVIDVPDATIDETVVLARRRALAAYQHAYYDPAHRDELIARIGRERGEDIDTNCLLNDRRPQPAEGSVVAGPAQVREALPRTTFHWQYKQDFQEFDSLFLNVEAVPDTVVMTVLTDIHRVCPVQVEECVFAIEEIAVEAALDPAARTAVSGMPAGRAAG